MHIAHQIKHMWCSGSQKSLAKPGADASGSVVQTHCSEHAMLRYESQTDLLEHADVVLHVQDQTVAPAAAPT